MSGSASKQRPPVNTGAPSGYQGSGYSGIDNTAMAADMASAYAQNHLFNGAPMDIPASSSSGGGGGGVINAGVATPRGGLFAPPPEEAERIAREGYGRNDIRNVMAQQFTDQDMAAYMNPYTNQVVDAAMADLSRQRDLTLQENQAAAAAAGAFGGSRHGVLEAETNRNYFDVAGQQAAELRDQAFRTGAGLAQSDMDRQLQAVMANQNVDATTARMALQAAQANQAAQNQRQEFVSSTETGANVSRYQADSQRAAAAARAAASMASAQMQNELGQQRLAMDQQRLGLDALTQLGRMGQQQHNLGLTGSEALMQSGDLFRQHQALPAQNAWQLPQMQLGLIQNAVDPGFGGTVTKKEGASPLLGAVGSVGGAAINAWG